MGGYGMGDGRWEMGDGEGEGEGANMSSVVKTIESRCHMVSSLEASETVVLERKWKKKRRPGGGGLFLGS